MSKTFRGQTATLSIKTSSGTTVAVGALQNVELSVESETEELEGQSIKRIDVHRTSVRLPVSAEHGQFDITGLKELIGYDDTNDEIKDTPEMPQFVVTGNFQSVDGNVNEDMKIKGVVFEDITLGWDRDSYVTEDLSGEGDDVEFIDQTA